MVKSAPTSTPEGHSFPRGLGNWILICATLLFLGVFVNSGGAYGTWITLQPALLNPVLALVIAASARRSRGSFMHCVVVAHVVLTVAWITAVIVGASIRDAYALRHNSLHFPSLSRAVPLTLIWALVAHTVVATVGWAIGTGIHARRFRPHIRSTLVMATFAFLAPVVWFWPTSDFSLLHNWTLRASPEPSPSLGGVHVLFLGGPRNQTVRHWDAESGKVVDLPILDDPKYAKGIGPIDVIDGTQLPLRLRVKYKIADGQPPQYAEDIIECPPLGSRPAQGWEVGRFSEASPREWVETSVANLRTTQGGSASTDKIELHRLLRAPFFYSGFWWMRAIGMHAGRLDGPIAIYDRHLLDNDVLIGVCELRLVVIDGGNRIVTDLGTGRGPVILVPRDEAP